jgi:nitrogen fixation NifU-like protein
MAEQDSRPSIDRIFAALQAAIAEQERALYSEIVLREARNPTHLEVMEDADAVARILGWCGDTMQFYLRLDGGRIEAATFTTDGCGPTVACGNMLARMVCGMSLSEAGQIAPRDLIRALDGLPEENLHCADLAVNTLRKALLAAPGKE